MKTCTRCKRSKKEDQFSKKSSNANGLEPECRQCKSEKRSPNKGQRRRGTYYPDEYGDRYDDAGY